MSVAGNTRREVLGAAALALLGVTGCGGGGESSSKGGAATVAGTKLEKSSVRMAFQEPAVTAVPFEKWRRDLTGDGLGVSSVEFQDATQALRALLVGEVDVASLPPLPLLQYMQQTGKADFSFLVANRQNTDYLLVSSPDINDESDLNGKTIGISTPGDVSDTLTKYVFKKAGLDVGSMKFVQVGGTSARMAAILSGQIDAGAAHSSDGYTAEEKGGAKVLLRYADHIDSYLQPGIVASKEFVENNPKLTQHLVDTYIDSVRWAVDKPQEFKELALEWLEGISETAVTKSQKLSVDTDTWALNGGLEPDVIQSTVDIERSLGTLKGDPPQMEDWVDTRFVDDYLKREGRR